MDRTVTPLSRRRGAGTLLACAVASAALLVPGCSSNPGKGPGEGESPAAAPTPEAVRFADLPNACRTLDVETIAAVVPKASNEKGDELPSENVTLTSTCLWSGLDGYDFRSLTVTLKRFESDLALGTGDERAGKYLRAQTAEIVDDEANEDVAEAEVAELGDESVGIAYTAEKENGERSRNFRQHRVVTRTANVVVTVDYAGTGFEGGDLPSAKSVKKSAVRAATESVAAMATTEGEGDTGGEGETDG
jgi:hypothetical protein